MATGAEFNKALNTTRAAQQTADNARSAYLKQEQDAKKVLQLDDSISALQRFKIAPAKAAMDAAEKALKPYKDGYVAYVNLHKNDPGYPTPSDTLTLNGLLSQIAPLQKTVNDNKQIIADAEATIKSIKTERAKIDGSKYSVKKGKITSKKGAAASTTEQAPKGKKIKFSSDYKYNAPMVSSSYFGAPSFVDTILEGNFVDQGKYGDARQAWKGTTGGRGTIQMDEKFLSTFSTSAQTNTKVKIDTQKYGFKFLYNPQTVSMAWGLMSSMDPYYEATQLDKFQVVSTALMSSTVSFELLLNRIQDFDYLNETGLSTGNIPQFTNTTTLAGIAAASTVKNPYPENVDPEDLKEIWQKGTMYDLEYLFKTINGPDGTFVSKLNGSTADRGWMRPTIVELHLGNSMRYRVRISEFAVNHIMFNSRMVPILSSVKLTCSRFADGPEVDGSSSSSSSSTTASSSTWTSSPGPSDLRAGGFR